MLVGLGNGRFTIKCSVSAGMVMRCLILGFLVPVAQW